MPTPLIRFSQQKPAQLLLVYLKHEGIEGQITPKSGLDNAHSFEQLKSPKDNIQPHLTVYELSIDKPDDIDRAITIANEFFANPNASKYQQAAWDIGETAPRTSSGSLLQGFDIQSLRDWKKHIFTHTVAILCIVIYAFMALGYDNQIFASLKMQYFTEISQNHEWWRLFGPNFMHGSAVHLIFNVCWWWLLGSKIERMFGTSSLIIFFVISTLAANVSQLMFSGPNFLGLSGVIYALFGFIWWIGFLRPNWGLTLPSGIINFMLVWLVIGYFDVLWVSTANEAHTFGLISGCLMALLMHITSKVAANKKSR